MTELDILDSIHGCLSCQFMDVAMPAISYSMTFDIIWVAISLVLMTSKRLRMIGVSVLLALIVTEIIGNGILKPLIDRPRPFEVESVELLIPAPMTSSFPSVHTACAVAAAVVVFFFDRKYAVVAFIFAALVALSRMYLYVHYPTDILAGVILGIICGYAGYKLAGYLVEKTALKGYVESWS